MKQIRKLCGVCALIVSAFIALIALGDLTLSGFGVGLLLFTGLGGMFLICS